MIRYFAWRNAEPTRERALKLTAAISSDIERADVARGLEERGARQSTTPLGSTTPKLTVESRCALQRQLGGDASRYRVSPACKLGNQNSPVCLRLAHVFLDVASRREARNSIRERREEADKLGVRLRHWRPAWRDYSVDSAQTGIINV